MNECFLNEEHLRRLKALGEVATFANSRTEDEAIERLKGADVAVIDGFLCPPTARVLNSADRLKLVVLPHTGYFMVDLQAAAAKGIMVANAPGFSREAVAEMVIGLMFAVNRRIPLMDKAMRKDPFESDPGDTAQQEAYWGFDLKGKTMGIIGLGRIGSAVAALALGLGMKVIANNRSPKTMGGVEMTTKEDVLKRADVISLNITSSNDARGFIGAKEFGMMKPTAIFLNVDQGIMVDTDALYAALKNRTIGGAGLDQIEGLVKGHPLLSLENAVFTPHAGSSTNESFRVNLPELVVSAIEGFAAGRPTNLVS